MLSDARLEEIRQRLDGVRGFAPWTAYDSPESWSLHSALGPYQILKAPKKGTPYAEYWPNEKEADFIVHSPEDVGLLLNEVETLRKTIALIRETFPATGRHRAT